MNENEAFERRAEAAVARANERIANCHKEVACPKCGAPKGARCTRAPANPRNRDVAHLYLKPLKHPHRERWTRVVPAR